MNISPYAAIQVAFFIGTYASVILLGRLFQGQVETPQSNKSRYSHLDGVRALAAIGVVACHTNQHLLAFFGFTEIPEYGNRIGIISVQMFFALTAFLFTERALNLGLDPAKFYIGRVRRIVPLYVFVAVCTIFLGIYLAIKPVEGLMELAISAVDIFAYGFIGGAPLTILGFNAERLIGVAWTLSYEWKFYVVFPILFFLATSSNRLAILMVLVIATLAARDYYVIGEVVWPFFVVGLLAAYLKKNAPTISEPIKKALSFIAACLVVVAVLFPGNFSAPHLLIATVLFLCILFGEPAILKIGALQVIGVISYSYYLLQYLVLAPTVYFAWFMDIGAASGYWRFATAFFIPAVLVPLSCLTYRFIERPWTDKKPASAQSGDKSRVDVVQHTPIAAERATAAAPYTVG